MLISSMLVGGMLAMAIGFASTAAFCGYAFIVYALLPLFLIFKSLILLKQECDF